MARAHQAFINHVYLLKEKWISLQWKGFLPTFLLHENSPFFVPTTSKYLSSFKKIKKHTQTFTHKHTLSLVHHVVGRLKCRNCLEIVLSWMVNPLEREKNKSSRWPNFFFRKGTTKTPYRSKSARISFNNWSLAYRMLHWLLDGQNQHNFDFVCVWLKNEFTLRYDVSSIAYRYQLNITLSLVLK